MFSTGFLEKSRNFSKKGMGFARSPFSLKFSIFLKTPHKTLSTLILKYFQTSEIIFLFVAELNWELFTEVDNGGDEIGSASAMFSFLSNDSDGEYSNNDDGESVAELISPYCKSYNNINQLINIIIWFAIRLRREH